MLFMDVNQASWQEQWNEIYFLCNSEWPRFKQTGSKYTTITLTIGSFRFQQSYSMSLQLPRKPQHQDLVYSCPISSPRAVGTPLGIPLPTETYSRQRKGTGNSKNVHLTHRLTSVLP